MATDIRVNRDNSTKIDVLDMLRNQIDKAKSIDEVMNIRHIIENIPKQYGDVQDQAPVLANAPLVSDTPNEKIDNVGGIDWNNIFNTLINQQKNKGRPIVNRVEDSAKGSAKSGLSGVGEILATGPKGTEADSKNPLAQYLMSLKRMVGTTAAKIAGQPVTKEQQALEALEKLYGKKGIFEKDALGNPLKGLSKYAGAGRFDTPYGQMYIDESGTLTKLPTNNAPAITNSSYNYPRR